MGSGCRSLSRAFPLVPRQSRLWLATREFSDLSRHAQGCSVHGGTPTPLPQETRDDPRIALIETQAVISPGEFQRAQVTATKAIEKAKAQGAKLLVARAYLWDCWASISLDQLDRATASCEAAKRRAGAHSGSGGGVGWSAVSTFQQSSDRGGVGAIIRGKAGGRFSTTACPLSWRSGGFVFLTTG